MIFFQSVQGFQSNDTPTILLSTALAGCH